jgi:hypothetical protein
MRDMQKKFQLRPVVVDNDMKETTTDTRPEWCGTVHAKAEYSHCNTTGLPAAVRFRPLLTGFILVSPDTDRTRQLVQRLQVRAH